MTLKTAILVMAGVFIGVFSISTTAYAQLTHTSPNPADMLAGNVQGGVSHLLKKETVANVLRLKLGAYYPKNTRGNTTDETLQIRYGIQGKKCIIHNIGGHFGDDNAFVQVTIRGKTNKVYKIPISNVCDDIGGTPRDNVAVGEAGDWKKNRFFANYAYPQQLPKDETIGGKYKALITIEYSNRVQEGGSDTNSVNFIAQTSSFNAILGPLSSDVATEFGLRSAYFKEGSRRSVQVSQQFGVPCDGNTVNRSVRLYDPDVGVFGPTYVWVEVSVNGGRYRKLMDNEYNFSNHQYVEWQQDGSKRFKSTGGSRVASVITIRNMILGAAYKFVVLNPDSRNSPSSPNSNVLSISIPEDAIYGGIANCNYNLVPEVKTLNPAMYSSYPNINVTSTMDQTIDDGTVVGEHVWRTYAIRYDGEPNTNIAGNDTFDDSPCQHRIPNGWTSCDLILGTSYPAASDSVDTLYNSGGPDGPDTRLCFVSVVKKPRDGSPDNQWRYSDMKCARTAKKPTVQFRGSDLKVNGMIKTSTTEAKESANQPLKTFGSWVEYGVFSTGANQMAGSGASLRGGTTRAVSERSALTFANVITPQNPTYGNFTPLPAPSNAVSYFNGLQGVSGLNSAVSGVYDVGNITVGSNLNIPEEAKGRSLIIRSSGTVTINSAIEVDNINRRSVREISQIVILAKDIKIQNNVGRVDAWLLTRAGGSIDTCSNTVVANGCRTLLEVNGAISMSPGSKLYLKRTGGADESGFATAAEVFRLRPDAQLWAYNYFSATDRAQTVYLTELPPRY